MFFCKLYSIKSYGINLVGTLLRECVNKKRKKQNESWRKNFN